MIFLISIFSSTSRSHLSPGNILSKHTSYCLEIHIIVFVFFYHNEFFDCLKCLFVYFGVNVNYFSHCYCVLSTDSNRNVI